MTTTDDRRPTTDDRPPRFYLLRRLFQPRELVIVGVLLLEILVFGLKSPEFISPNLLLGAANYVAIIGVAAIGASLVIIAGGIDLSSGAVYGLCGVCAALWMTDPGHPAPALLALLGAVAVGLAFGAVNGAAVAWLRIPPFIVTLGTLSIAAGLALRLTGGEHLPTAQRPFSPGAAAWLEALNTRLFARSGPGAGFEGISVALLATMALALLAALFLHGTIWGRYIFALGGSEEATRHSGVRVERVKVLVYTLAGGLAALAGLFYLARYKGINSGVGRGQELNIIAASVVGGVSLSGGRGSPLGALVGALIIKLLEDGLIFNEAKQEDAQIAIGAFIILAVLVDRLLPELGRRVQVSLHRTDAG